MRLGAQCKFVLGTGCDKLQLASNPGLPRPDFILQPWRKSGQGRSGFEAKPQLKHHIVTND